MSSNLKSIALMGAVAAALTAHGAVPASAQALSLIPISETTRPS